MSKVKKYKILPIQHTGVKGLVFNHGEIVREDQLNDPQRDLKNGNIEPYEGAKKEPPAKKTENKKGKPKGPTNKK